MDKQISSGLKTLFLIHFIVGIFFGLIMFFLPVVYSSVLKWNMQEPGALRLIGAAMLGISFTSLLAYLNPFWEKVRITVLMEIVWTGLGALATIWAVLYEGFPSIAYLNAALFAIFTVCFLMFYLKEK